MTIPLPHPNIVPPPDARLDSPAIIGILSEIQRNLDALSLQPSPRRIMRGLVNAEGGIVFGSDFSVTRTETGVYRVTFDAPFPATPVVVGCDAGATQRTFSVAINPEYVDVVMSNWNAERENISFSFIAIG